LDVVQRRRAVARRAEPEHAGRIRLGGDTGQHDPRPHGRDTRATYDGRRVGGCRAGLVGHGEAHAEADHHDRLPPRHGHRGARRRLRPGRQRAPNRGALMRRILPALAIAALIAAAPAAAFTPTDPLATKQWHLQDDHAFDFWAEPPTTLAPVKIAIVDSGADCSLPDFQGRIIDKKSFVGGDPCLDTEGHGTFIAGEIAANLDGQGIVGMAYTAQLLIAKVVKPDGSIPLDAEAAAIRWAANSGARVINLSLGGVRDPVH